MLGLSQLWLESSIAYLFRWVGIEKVVMADERVRKMIKSDMCGMNEPEWQSHSRIIKRSLYRWNSSSSPRSRPPSRQQRRPWLLLLLLLLLHHQHHNPYHQLIVIFLIIITMSITSSSSSINLTIQPLTEPKNRKSTENHLYNLFTFDKNT